MRTKVIALLLLLAAFPIHAQVPTPDEFLGYTLGEQFTSYERILDYFHELARRSDLVTVQTFGQTYEGRPLVLATITSAKNRQSLDALQKGVASLGNADQLDPSRATEIARTTPAVVWLAFGIHGNESSSAEAAMRVASTLLRDSASATLLDNLVILIDPLQNPDGRERYIEWFRRTRGAAVNPTPDAFEHSEPWPGGRFNHYLIDMNRDWTWMSQRETQARTALYQQWYPQVFVDFHEMGSQSSYFFPPTARPVNVNFPKQMEQWFETFGRANADAFSKHGWPFFVSERFDFFYPGYGDSWPSFHGAIGMTYEVAGGGRAGTAIEREDQTLLRLADRIERHYTTAMTTLRTAAEHREELLRYTYGAMRASLDSGKNTYFIAQGSPGALALIETLQRQGIRVSMLTGPLTIRATRGDRDVAENRTFPAGTAVVTTRQPLGALAQTLLERNAVLAKGFVEEQRAKAEVDEPDDFYDLTTWSAPLAMNVESWLVAAPAAAQLTAWSPPARAAFTPAPYGYLVDGFEPNLYRLIGAMLRRDVRFSVADAELILGEQSYPRGSIVILKGNNKPDLDDTLGALARDNRVTIVPLQSGWVGGTALGSEKIHFVRTPKIALVGGNGVGPTSFGMLWHTLDIDTPIPHTVIALDALRNVDLSRYNVLVLPDGDYTARVPKREVEKLQIWLRAGGTIVAVKGASSFLRSKDVEISKLKPWEPPKKKDEKSEETPKEERYNDFRVPGSAFRTTMNERSFLTVSVPRPPAVLIEGSAAYVPVSHLVDNIVTIEKEDPVASGVAWQESIDRLKGSAFLVSEPYGRGNVITFADEPHFRLFWRGTLPLFLNAVLYSPSFPR